MRIQTPLLAAPFALWRGLRCAAHGMHCQARMVAVLGALLVGLPLPAVAGDLEPQELTAPLPSPVPVPVPAPIAAPAPTSNALALISQRPVVRAAMATVYAQGNVQNLSAEQQAALTAYINALVDGVYAFAFDDVAPQLAGTGPRRDAGEPYNPLVHPFQKPWQAQWQTLRSLLLGYSVDSMPTLEEVLGRMRETEKSRSLSLAVAQVDKALLRLKPNSKVALQQLMFRLNALYIVLEGQIPQAFNVNLDFSDRKGWQASSELEAEPEPYVVIEEEVIVDTPRAPTNKASAKKTPVSKSTGSKPAASKTVVNKASPAIPKAKKQD